MLHTILWIICVLLGSVGLGLLRTTKKVANNIVIDTLCCMITIWLFLTAGLLIGM